MVLRNIYKMSEVALCFLLYFFVLIQKVKLFHIHTRITYVNTMFLSTTVIGTLQKKWLDLNRKKSTVYIKTPVYKIYLL